MFLLNSRQDHFTAAPSRGRPFSRSYGAILPNSLTEVLPFALVFSTRLPVSVCGTVSLLQRQPDFLGGRTRSLLARRPGITVINRLPPESTYRLNYPTPSLLYSTSWYWNINQLSIAYAFQPRLRPD